MIDINNFLQAKYIFDPQPSSNPILLLSLLIFFIILLVLSIVAKKYFEQKARTLPSYQNLANMIYSPFLTCAILGIVLIFFRWQELPYLSSRFLIYLLLVFIIIWSAAIFYYYNNKFKGELDEFARKQRFNKYIPKAKKKKNE